LKDNKRNAKNNRNIYS